MNPAATQPLEKVTARSRAKLDSPLTLRDLIAPLFYFRRAALIALLVPIALALAAALLAKPVYEAQSRLLVLLGQEYIYRADPADAGTSVSFDRAQIMHAEMEILGSRSLRLATLKTVTVKRLYPGMSDDRKGLEAAAEQLEKDLRLENVPQSNIIDLSLRHRDPEVAAETLNTLIRLYLERRRAVFQQADVPAIRQQRRKLSDDLLNLENEIAGLAGQHGFGDYAQELAAVQTQQADLTGQLHGLDQQLATRSGRAALLSRRLAAAPGTLELSVDESRSQQIDALTQSLVSLQAQRREAAARYTDGYPLIADLDGKIATVQAQIAQAPRQQFSAVRRGVNPVRQELDTALADAQGDVAGLRQGRVEVQRALVEVNARLAELVEVGPRYRDLSRRRELLETAVSALDRRAQETELADTLSRSKANVRIVQSADPPSKGRSGRLVLLAAGTALGLLAAASVVVLGTALSTSVSTPRELEQKLGVPAILAIAESDGEIRPARGGGPGSRYMTHDDAETIMRLLYSVPSAGGRVLQLAASTEGEGVTNLVLDLALLSAQTKTLKILILDVHSLEGTGAAVRLVERGAELEDEAPGNMFKLKGRSVYVSAPIGSRSLAVVDEAWEKVISRARSKFDLVIVDGPPLARSSAAITLAPLVDLTLVVVEAEVARTAAIRNLIDRIEATGAEVTGAILNKRRFHIPPWLYGRL